MYGIAQKILANPAKYSLQQLTDGVQSGVIPAYIGIPLIQERIQEKKEAQAMPMAQNQPPIAEQVLAESSGIDKLPSGLPQSYAGGGIIAFEEGGPVDYGIGGAVRKLVGPTEYKTATDLYRNILGREPESKEALENWTATLGDTIDAEDVARFTSSAAPELIARTPAHISNLYQKYLNRAPDLGGAAYWGERFGDEVDPDELATFTRAAQDEIAARTPVNTGGGGGGNDGLARTAINAGLSYALGPMYNYANAGHQFLQGDVPGAATSLISGLTGGASGIFKGLGFKEGGPVERYQNQGEGLGIVALADGGMFDDDDEEDDAYDKEMSKARSMMESLRQRISNIQKPKETASSDFEAGIADLMPELVATESKEGVSVKRGNEPSKSIERRSSSISQPADLEKLIALVQQKESGGRRNDREGNVLTSPKGAMGEMQVMPGTARDPGFGITPARAGDLDDLARVGKEYFAKMMQRYGDPKLAAVAYNWGPGNTDKWLMAGADPSRLPEETRNYIRGFAEGGPVHFDNGGISSIFDMTPEEVRDRARRMLKMDQARSAFSAAPVADVAKTAVTEAPKTTGGIRSLLGRFGLPLGIATTGFEALNAYMDKKQKEELAKYGPEPELTKEEIERASKPAFMGDVSMSPKVQEERGIKALAPLTYTPAGVETYGQRPNYTPPPKAGVTQDVITPIADQVVTPQTLAPLQAEPSPEAAISQAAPVKESAASTPESDYMAELRRQIAEGRAGMKNQREIDNYMSLLSAGLGMLGGTSPNAAANIGAGAMQGIGAYQRAAQLRGADERSLLSAQLGLGKLAGYDAYKQEALGLRKDIAEQELLRKKELEEGRRIEKQTKKQQDELKLYAGRLSEMERFAQNQALAEYKGQYLPEQKDLIFAQALNNLRADKGYRDLYKRVYGYEPPGGMMNYDPKTRSLR